MSAVWKPRPRRRWADIRDVVLGRRSSVPTVDQLIYGDLVAAYNFKPIPEGPLKEQLRVSGKQLAEQVRNMPLGEHVDNVDELRYARADCTLAATLLGVLSRWLPNEEGQHLVEAVEDVAVWQLRALAEWLKPADPIHPEPLASVLDRHRPEDWR